MIKENDNNIQAKIVGKQLINNAFIAAGIVEDINTLIEIVLNVEKDFAASGVCCADATDVSDMKAHVNSVDAEATEYVQDAEKEGKAQKFVQQ